MHRRLLIRPGAIGDCILSLPVLEAARAGYTEVWAPRPVLPLIRFADRTRAIIDTGLDLVGVTGDAHVPLLETFDSIYSWYGTQRPEFRDAVAHLPFTFFPAFPIPHAGPPRIPVPPCPVENFAVIHPFSGSPHKNWPIEKFRSLAAKLPMPVKWCVEPGLSGDERGNEFLDGSRDDVAAIADLYDLGAWLSTARIYIGNDSGISHLAAAVGAPVVAIFLTTDPRVWAPRGPHVLALENPEPEDVLRGVGRMARPSS